MPDEDQNTPQAQKTSTEPEQAATPAKPERARNGVKQVHQAAFIQRFVFDSIKALKQNCTNSESGLLVMDVKTAVAVQKLAGAWDTMADRVRILRGQGLPASVRSKGSKTPAQVQPLAE